MEHIDTLAERYKRFVVLPWRKDLAGAERVIFVVYDKSDERRLRVRRTLFELATREAGHGWIECDLTDVFARWMAGVDYRDSYFESPEDLHLKLDDDFLAHVTARVRDKLTAPEADDDCVVAIFGIASLFGFIRVSELMKSIDRDIRGRALVFFPGEHEGNNYRLLNARDGWNYLATPITLHDDRAVYDA